MHKKSWFWFLVVVVVFMAAWWGYRYFDTYKYAPRINPHPKYFVTISGNIEPHMPYPQTLMFRATYGTYNPKCDVWISFMEGVKGSRGHPVYYPVHPNAKGDYQVKIPIDAYKPGMCDWKAAWIRVAYPKNIPPKNTWNQSGLWSDLISFGEVGSSNESPSFPMHSKGDITCGEGGFDNCQGYALSGVNSKISITRSRSYYLVQNIKSGVKRNDTKMDGRFHM